MKRENGFCQTRISPLYRLSKELIKALPSGMEDAECDANLYFDDSSNHSLEGRRSFTHSSSHGGPGRSS